MRVSRSLHLVIPVTRADGTEIYVHSTPISADVFETHFLVLSKTFAAIYGEGLGAIAGPRVANKLLKKIAKDLGTWDGPGGVERSLMAEIRRLTNVLAPGQRGWETYPFDDAVTKGVLDREDGDEIEAAASFFTVASCMHRRADLKEILDGSMKLWGARTESLNCSEFMSSLQTSTAGASSGVRAVA